MMEDVIKLTDRQFDYLKKLVADDIQKKIADRDNDATLDRADLLLRLIKIHALERRQSSQNPLGKEEQPAVNHTKVKKVCNKCGISKPLDEFANNACMRDGKTNMCKACVRVYQNERNRKKVK